MFFESGRELDARQDIIAVMETVNAARGIEGGSGGHEVQSFSFAPQTSWYCQEWVLRQESVQVQIVDGNIGFISFAWKVVLGIDPGGMFHFEIICNRDTVIIDGNGDGVNHCQYTSVRFF